MELLFALLYVSFLSPAGRCDTLSTVQPDSSAVVAPLPPAAPQAPEVISMEMITVEGSHTDVDVEYAEEEEAAEVVISHLLFKGVPLDGPLAEFGKGLEKAGFRKEATGRYAGTFAGIDEVSLQVFDAVGNVWCVRVSFPCHGNWASTREEYTKFKNWFEWKYVVPPVTVKERLSSRFKEGSGQEAWGFENGSSVYESLFSFDDGRVRVFVLYDRLSGGTRVCIDYVDRVNYLLKEKSEMMDL